MTFQTLKSNRIAIVEVGGPSSFSLQDDLDFEKHHPGHIVEGDRPHVELDGNK